MTAVTTISGTAAYEGGTAAYYSVAGRLTGAESFDRIAEELPDAGVDVTVGHDGEHVGSLIYGEITSAGAVTVVAVLHDDTILRIRSAIYLSPDLLVVGARGTRSRHLGGLAGMTSLALTTSPAGHGLSAIRVREGDLRNLGDRGSWPIGWASEDPLLRRALDALDGRRRVTRLQRHAPRSTSGWIDLDGRSVGGPMHYRGGGRVLAGR
jgi:hypothetical protein